MVQTAALSPMVHVLPSGNRDLIPRRTEPDAPNTISASQPIKILLSFQRRDSPGLRASNINVFIYNSPSWDQCVRQGEA